MKLLLTSGGVRNPTITDALVGMLGKPIAECNALFIPTAQYGHPACTPGSVWQSIAGPGMCDLGWKSVGVLEVTALPSIVKDKWVSWIREADVLLVDGGEATYLCHWMRQSRLIDLLTSLSDTVWVGMSAGSMVLTPRIGEEFVEWQSLTGSDEALGVVDFSIFPHLNYPDWPDNTLDRARQWATKIPGPAYAIDDETAISVVDGVIEVLSEGHWELLHPFYG